MELFDLALGIAVVNLVTMVGNVYFSLKLKQTKTQGELIEFWKDKHDIVNETLRDTIEHKNNIKKQYNMILHEQLRLKGRVGNLEKIHDLLSIKEAT